ncbi:hypothetical protein SAMN02745116_01343 [Pilibacter termitis]|uniref:Holin-like toxin n=1 Tax=Pilibacter termitis TaxID=263852 RepID=A0A1T4N8D7_9ENTE|nr:hypothetical protein SAMN02745116_01343 [Pilibacter termitis]
MPMKVGFKVRILTKGLALKMTVAEALSLMLAFGSFVATLIFGILEANKKK